MTRQQRVRYLYYMATVSTSGFGEGLVNGTRHSDDFLELPVHFFTVLIPSYSWTATQLTPFITAREIVVRKLESVFAAFPDSHSWHGKSCVACVGGNLMVFSPEKLCLVKRVCS
ncbi:hypothetical protein TNCV_3358791 [Trichonephila clavipes]|nr:hypothetical protein TNCV_3358791 [Trichonephila clavipes]